mgnify:CR=1 FL=1
MYIGMFTHSHSLTHSLNRSYDSPTTQVDEWVPVAHALQQKGHFVLLLNFHSNPSTTPALFFGGFSDANVQALLREAVMNGYFKGRHRELVVFGKSWGGKQAMQVGRGQRQRDRGRGTETVGVGGAVRWRSL